MGSDRNQFRDIIEEMTGVQIDDILMEKKPLQWRHFIVRAVCCTEGKMGEVLRNLWIK